MVCLSLKKLKNKILSNRFYKYSLWISIAFILVSNILGMIVSDSYNNNCYQEYYVDDHASYNTLVNRVEQLIQSNPSLTKYQYRDVEYSTLEDCTKKYCHSHFKIIRNDHFIEFSIYKYARYAIALEDVYPFEHIYGNQNTFNAELERFSFQGPSLADDNLFENIVMNKICKHYHKNCIWYIFNSAFGI